MSAAAPPLASRRVAIADKRDCGKISSAPVSAEPGRASQSDYRGALVRWRARWRL
ncbi:hypothetical protein IWW55_006078 [Coemansia sp. RSA 2706]|nr:hypothetical protein IWW55_006078 [Coemansia sp. RSA 2706]